MQIVTPARACNQAGSRLHAALNPTAGFYSPKYEIEIGRKFPPNFGLKLPSPLDSFPSLPHLHSPLFHSPFSLLQFPVLYTPFP